MLAELANKIGMDKLVIDIETKNTFADVGGHENLRDLEMSFVGVYSYNQNQYLSFFEHQTAELDKILKTAGLIVGFNHNRFDIPILNKYMSFDLFNIPRFDLLEELEFNFGQRVSLDILARTNLNIGKTHHSLEATKFYQAGDLESLKNYCLNDVKITKDLYDLAKKQGHLLVPKKITGEIIKVPFKIQEIFLPATLL